MKSKAEIGDTVLRAMLIPALVFGLATLAPAQTAPAEAKPAAAKAKSPTGAEPSGGPQEGIKVHGHWTIVVRDPDGKEVSRREFENALTSGGKDFLAVMLTKQAYSNVSEWAITLRGPYPNENLQGLIVEPTSSQGMLTDPGMSKTLAVNFWAHEASVELKGNTRALAGSTINSVETWIFTTFFYPEGGAGVFSRATLPSPQSVSVGQLVEVTVVFSFS